MEIRELKRYGEGWLAWRILIRLISYTKNNLCRARLRKGARIEKEVGFLPLHGAKIFVGKDQAVGPGWYKTAPLALTDIPTLTVKSNKPHQRERIVGHFWLDISDSASQVSGFQTEGNRQEIYV